MNLKNFFLILFLISNQRCFFNNSIKPFLSNKYFYVGGLIGGIGSYYFLNKNKINKYIREYFVKKNFKYKDLRQEVEFFHKELEEIYFSKRREIDLQEIGIKDIKKKLEEDENKFDTQINEQEISLKDCGFNEEEIKKISADKKEEFIKNNNVFQDSIEYQQNFLSKENEKYKKIFDNFILKLKDLLKYNIQSDREFLYWKIFLADKDDKKQNLLSYIKDGGYLNFKIYSLININLNNKDLLNKLILKNLKKLEKIVSKNEIKNNHFELRKTAGDNSYEITFQIVEDQNNFVDLDFKNEDNLSEIKNLLNLDELFNFKKEDLLISNIENCNEINFRFILDASYVLQ